MRRAPGLVLLVLSFLAPADDLIQGGAPATYVREASYILRTGASWKGRFGYAEAVVRLPETMPPIRLVSLRRLGLHDAFEVEDWSRRPKGTVVWSGFAKPTLRGHEIRFVRRGFEPGESDDVDVCFGAHRSEQNGVPASLAGIIALRDDARDFDFLLESDMPQSTRENASPSRLVEQLDGLAAAGCCPQGDMIVFPIAANSGSLAELAKMPGVTIERIGPDVVRVRRVAQA